MIFALFAFGYPFAQGGYCAEHLGHAIASDASTGGSTMRWEIRPAETIESCRICDRQEPGRDSMSTDEARMATTRRTIECRHGHHVACASGVDAEDGWCECDCHGSGEADRG